MSESTPFLSVIVPVYNGGEAFTICLKAVMASSYKNFEMIVVDDGSTDASVSAARMLGAKILSTSGRHGPARARNIGAAEARGSIICFIDADCEPHPDTLHNMVEAFRNHPDIAAVFGCYDDQPAQSNFVSQYKNLFHSYIHRNGNEDASTFWAGCGGIKRSIFQAVSGFDAERYPRSCIEDIELGYRVRSAGGKILLDKSIQVKHHKKWTFAGLIKSDLFDRGIPWTALMLQRADATNDLNLKTGSRVSVIAAYFLVAALLATPFVHEAIWMAAILAATLTIINFDFYRFFIERRGFWFALKVVPLHWLYYLYCGLAASIGTLSYLFRNNPAALKIDAGS